MTAARFAYPRSHWKSRYPPTKSRRSHFGRSVSHRVPGAENHSTGRSRSCLRSTGARAFPAGRSAGSTKSLHRIDESGRAAGVCGKVRSQPVRRSRDGFSELERETPWRHDYGATRVRVQLFAEAHPPWTTLGVQASSCDQHARPVTCSSPMGRGSNLLCGGSGRSCSSLALRRKPSSRGYTRPQRRIARAVNQVVTGWGTRREPSRCRPLTKPGT